MSNSNKEYPLANIIGLAAIAVSVYGIAHAFAVHGTGSGFGAIFFPPYALYMGLEGIFWH